MTQDALADSVRQLWGLEWSRATVTAVELGRREVTALELLALSDVFLLSPNELLLDEFAEPRTTWFQVSDTSAISGTAVARAFRSGRTGHTTDGRDTPWMREASRQITSLPEIAAALVAEGVEPNDERLAAVLQGERGEAERKAAARLGVDLRTLAILSVGLWGQSLTQEREARVHKRTPSSPGSQSIRTMKGHVTRELLAELQEVIGGGR